MSNYLDLFDLQQEVGEWQHGRWPQDEGDFILKGLKFAEEAGEVARALIRVREGRGTIDDVAGEMADCIIVLCGLAECLGIDLADAIDHKWAATRVRVWDSRPAGRATTAYDEDVHGPAIRLPVVCPVSTTGRCRLACTEPCKAPEGEPA